MKYIYFLLDIFFSEDQLVNTSSTSSSQQSGSSGGGAGRKVIEYGKETAIEAEVKAARERAIVPMDIRMKQFKDMLAEKEVR